MRVLDHFLSEPRECSYLPKETASLEYKIMLDVTSAELDQLLEGGWRRFGVAYFRPKCARCAECVPIRLPVDKFAPSKNQRRARNRTKHLRLEIDVPKVDERRVELYKAWHKNRHELRGWTEDEMDLTRYFHEFALPHPSAREFAYYDGDRLVAISLVDETPNALSAVYTYFDPEYADRSLGTASVVRQVEVARRAKKRWVYLGYRVMGCVSSEYKAKFGPHELLVRWPNKDQGPVWAAPGLVQLGASRP